MKTAKKSQTFRLSEGTIKELETLAKRYKRSQAEILALVIHAFHEQWDFEDCERWFEVPV